ncbi:helix-turn-helix transcriptional regulator [Streptomyces sp. NRRL F-5123]|uniref:helix-turn-helix transcriptional regulator n=1 Tax=Streptomyces sp. NRRL F-5123 TaxID=1463856 RepID=UPI0007C5A6F5|nr:LuxR family transcriptional regulator [Streptomyces sp. NRRL F-5123]
MEVSEPDGSGAPAVVHAPEFVGRTREFAELARALAAPPAAVWIEGEAGIGKSRLLREYVTGAAEGAGRVLVARCPPLHHPQTLGPLVDAVRQAVETVAGLPLSPLAGALRPLFPEWSGDLPAAPGPAEDATAVRHRVFRALAELLGRLDVAVLAVEDVHWADEATLEFLLFLASGVPQPVGLVVTCRPEDVAGGSLLRRLATRLAADSSSAAGRLRLPLGPLDVAATARLMSSMLAGEHVSDRLAGFVHQRTEGVPLAVEGAVRLMADRADLRPGAAGWGRNRFDEIGVPATVRDMVLERLGRLGRDGRAVLQAAAVLGRPADEATVRAVADLAAVRAQAGLAEALDRGLLDDDGWGQVAFRHALARQAVYDAIPPSRRRALHRRAGRTLEALVPPPVGELADHFRVAGERADWCRYAEWAADLALASGDETTAGTLLHDLAVNAGLPPASMARLIRKFPFASFAGPARFRELVPPLRAALAAGVRDPGQEADIRVQLGNVLLFMGEDDAGRAELKRAIPHLGHDPAEAARAMMRLGWPRSSSWPVPAHLRWLERAAELEVPSMTAADRIGFAADQATARLMLGETDGWELVARIPEAAAAPAEWQQIARANVNIGDMAMLWGRYAVAAQRLDTALALADRRRYRRYASVAVVTRTHLDWLTGAWDGLAERAAALAGSEDILPLARLELLLVVGQLQAAAGAYGPAAEQLRPVLEGEVGSGALADSMEPAAALARLALAAGRIEEALEITEEPAALIARKRTWVWASDLGPARVAALTAAGRVEEAAKLTAAFARGLRGRDAPGPRAGLAACRAVLAEARGEHASAARLFARAAAAWQALPRPYEALLAQERQAGCQLAAGKREAALSLLADVRERLIALGALGDADRVVARLREHGVAAKRPQRGGRRAHGNRLSPRELDVTRLVATGRSNRQIAEALFLSPKTVAQHLSSAMRKLGVSSRTALAVLATGTEFPQRDVPDRPSGGVAKNR